MISNEFGLPIMPAHVEKATQINLSSVSSETMDFTSSHATVPSFISFHNDVLGKLQTLF
jgi:hypothetical protein